MNKLSAQEIAEHAYNAGFRGQALTTAVAIALAESGGRPDAKGDTTITDGYWGPSIGLWQIRSVRKENGTGGERDAKANLNPATNAKHAWSVSKHGTFWTPWSVYKNGSYRQYLDTAWAAAQNAGRNDKSSGQSTDKQRHKAPQGTGRSGSDRIVLDLHELRGLQTFFAQGADRVRHVRRSISDIAHDLEPALSALADHALAALIGQSFQYLESPSELPMSEQRMEWHSDYAERVRRLAERADGADNKWTRADALRFAKTMNQSNRADHAVLEALVLGTVVRRRGDIRRHLDRSTHQKGHASPPARVDTSKVRNGHMPSSKLTAVGDGERLIGPAARQFLRMDAAARTAGLDLHVNSGYRTYAEQAQLYQDYRNGTGNLAAAPGHSTHGVGLSADINVTNPKVLSWLRDNASRYGFVNDVPSEPWHWTYKPR
jgi:lysozyme-like protein/D-alanyl-D-alanine carboxypeptidase-like protein